MAARHKKGRVINGILLFDKPIGMTSNAALQKVKRLFNAQKAGHTGSLDPLASGLLPICLGEATKISSYLLDSNKKYRAICQLGVNTSSADAEGEIISQCSVPAFDLATINQVLVQFTGELQQVPPMHSAIKQNGQPLYKLAHQGIEVHRDARTITIYALELIAFENEQLILDVECSKGTYIRTLCEDIGRELQCGAHLAGLRRSSVGPFDLAQAINFNDIDSLLNIGFDALDATLVAIEDALTHMPVVNLTENSAYYIKQGQAVLVSNAPTTGLVRLSCEQQQFIGIGHILDDGRVAPKRIMNY